MLELALTLAAALGLGMVAMRLHLPPLLGFLAAGFALKAVGLLPPLGLETIAELGVTLLLFSIGLKINPQTLIRREVWLTATVHMAMSVAVVSALLLAAGALGAGLLAGLDLSTIALVAFALSFSSTVLVVKLLEAQNQGQSLFGRIAIGILLIQDIAAVAFITLSGAESPSPWALALAGLLPVGWLLHRMLDRISHGELLIVFGTTCALLPGYVLFEAVGIKGDLGALVIGVILGRHARAIELSQAMWSVKNLFLVGFFVSIGFSIEGPVGLEHLLVAVALVAIIPLQTVAYVLLLRWQGLRTRTAMLTALALANNSEFALIVTAVGVETDLLDAEWLVVVALAVALSFVFSTLLGRRAPEITEWATTRMPDRPLERIVDDDRPIDIGPADAIVLGLGRVGRAAYLRLAESHGMRPIGIEIDAERADQIRAMGINAIQGDATDPDFWARCRRHPQVRLAVLAMPFHGSNVAALHQLRARGFRGTVAAISRFDDERDRILNLGADTAFQVYDGAGQSLADRAVDAARLGPSPAPATPSDDAPTRAELDDIGPEPNSTGPAG
ncbi:MAG: cation:proton antiporter family protein [Dermatophilaceae bacterium]